MKGFMKGKISPHEGFMKPEIELEKKKQSS
jgi:hypothetical protein